MPSRIAFLRGAVAEPFSGPVVELSCDSIAVVLREVFHALAVGKILPDQAVLRTIATTASWLSIVHPHRPPQTPNANIVKECP